ncbi:MFS transporter superfamily [Fusarium oxysporum f. sp. vasinfectum]|nr:MFS transporter superfamily [Fusarium oxysporum f. sp. vasinfectum]
MVKQPSAGEPAGPVVKGVIPTAKQALSDLFIWKQRVVITNEHGEETTEWRDPDPIKNPISLMAQLSGKDWIFFLVGFCAWTADAFDFHALSIQTKKLSWPMVFNMIILGVLQIATIYSTTFQQFLAVRSLFGLFMGGVYGNAIAMALESCPSNARGLMSGILQQGYSFGYVLAACANLGVGGSTESWKTVFWIAAGISIAVGIIRIFFPESQQFLEARAKGKKSSTPGAFWADCKKMLIAEWKMCVYCCFLMTWFNYYSHTSQDSYTTFMLEQKELNNSAASRASILMKTGACVGGTIIGYLSQFVGRRRAIIVSAFMSALMIPAWILPTTERGLSASGFFIQFFVQGAWGVIPIHLNELSPPAFRSSFPGVTYQIGNMISSPSAQIVNAIAEKTFVTLKNGDKVEAYGPVMGVATAIIALGIMFTTMFGPEKRGRAFEHAVAGVHDENLPQHQKKDIETASVEQVEMDERNKNKEEA